MPAMVKHSDTASFDEDVNVDFEVDWILAAAEQQRDGIRRVACRLPAHRIAAIVRRVASARPRGAELEVMMADPEEFRLLTGLPPTVRSGRFGGVPIIANMAPAEGLTLIFSPTGR